VPKATRNSADGKYWKNPPDRVTEPPVIVEPGDKPVPRDLEMEKAVISAVLVDRDAFPLIITKVSPSDFYDPRHQTILLAAMELFDRNQPIDPITVGSKLRENQELEKAGGLDYIADLTALSVPSFACEHYADTVRGYAALRRMIAVTSQITADAYNGGYNVQEFLAQAQEKILEATETRTVQSTVSMKELIPEAVNRLYQRRENNNLAMGISSGFESLDRILTGFKDTDSIVIAARPGAGKSAVALNIALNAARSGKKVLFHSLEMGMYQLADRLLCLQTNISSGRIQASKFIARDEMPRVDRAVQAMSDLPLYIDDSPKISALELRAKCRQMKMREGLDMVIVDYLQLMEPADKRSSREQQVSQLSRAMKALAMELKIPVIIISQLNRDTEKRASGDNRPKMSDLRESGAIEQDANVVILLYRPGYYTKQRGKNESNGIKRAPSIEAGANDEELGLLEAIVAKNRNGPTDVAKLRFYEETMYVEDFVAPRRREEIDW